MKPIRSKNNSLSFFMIGIALVIIILFIFKNHFMTRQKSVIDGKPLPLFSLPSLFDSATRVTQQSLSGHVFLLNFWASWCHACQTEQPTLLMIANTYRVPIYGIAYKDKIQNAKAWLNMASNPYAIIGMDTKGQLGSLLGVYGIPATFIVDKNGMIRYRHMGIMSQTDWEMILRPLIEKFEHDQN